MFKSLFSFKFTIWFFFHFKLILIRPHTNQSHKHTCKHMHLLQMISTLTSCICETSSDSIFRFCCWFCCSCLRASRYTWNKEEHQECTPVEQTNTKKKKKGGCHYRNSHTHLYGLHLLLCGLHRLCAQSRPLTGWLHHCKSSPDWLQTRKQEVKNIFQRSYANVPPSENIRVVVSDQCCNTAASRTSVYDPRKIWLECLQRWRKWNAGTSEQGTCSLLTSTFTLYSCDRLRAMISRRPRKIQPNRHGNWPMNFWCFFFGRVDRLGRSKCRRRRRGEEGLRNASILCVPLVLVEQWRSLDALSVW